MLFDFVEWICTCMTQYSYCIVADKIFKTGSHVTETNDVTNCRRLRPFSARRRTLGLIDHRRSDNQIYDHASSDLNQILFSVVALQKWILGRRRARQRTQWRASLDDVVRWTYRHEVFYSVDQ